MVERTPAIEIGGLELGPEIGRGARTVVHRARRRGQPVAVKIATFESDGGDGAPARFRREAGVLASVRHAALPAVLEVGETGSHAYLVLEYVEGITVARRIADRPLTEQEAVGLGRTLASALSALHRHGLVHRDVKPDNVILETTGRVRLIDFGLAVGAAAQPEGLFAGSLLYSAPEQSGVIRRNVDGRADLYSLGCVLFESVAGRPPFESRTISELLHQQASAPAPQLGAVAEVSPGFAAIVAKLLAKDPDDRYQSASGLLADLDRIQTLNALAEVGLGMVLGQHDLSPDAPEELRLVGRDRELEQLRRLWTVCLAGCSQLVLVEGEPGCGKSRLARELVRYARGRGGLVLAARGSEAVRTPLAPLRAAVEAWLRHVPDPERDETVAIVRAAAGQVAPLLRRLSPILASLLPPDEVAVGEAAGEQFLDTIAEFIRGVARARGGLVLLVDDAQWLDDATRGVLRRLAVPVQGSPLLSVVTRRTDAPDRSTEPGAEEGWHAEIERLRLGPLDPAAAADLVAQLLGTSTADEAVVRQVAPRAAGNPLAMGELVKAMLDTGVLRPHWGSWQLESDAVPSLDLPDDVLKLILRRVDQLTSGTQDLLAVAAVVGLRFDAGLLAQVERSTTSIPHAVDEAVAAGLIHRVEDGYAFVHDRVREALLSRLDADARRSLHQRVADALRAGDVPEGRLFELAQHAVQGHVAGDPAGVRATCLAAARAAIEGFADADAYQLLRQAEEIGQTFGLPPDLELETRLAEIGARLGLWTEAIGHLGAALASTQDPLRRARLHTQLAQAYMANRDAVPAWREVCAAFDQLDAPCPGGSLASLIGSVVQGVVGLFSVWSGFGYGRARPAQRERLTRLAQLYEAAAFVGYLLSDRRLVAQMMLRSLFVGSRLGETREMAVTWIGMGLVLGILGRPALAARAGAAGARIATAIGDQFTLARARAGEAWAQDVGGRPRYGAALARRCVEEHGRWMDAHAYWVVCADLAWNLVARGYSAEALQWVDRAARRAEATSRQIVGLSALRAGILATLGRVGDAREELVRARQAAAETPDEAWRQADALGWAALVCLESNDVGAALDEVASIHAQLGLTPSTSSFHARHFYLFDAHARLSRAARAPEHARPARLAELSAAIRRLEQAGDHPTLRAHWLVLQGALARLRGDAVRAQLRVSDAEALANAIDAPWPLFEALRLRAHLARDAGDAAAAQRYARAAAGLARDREWPNRASWIRAELGVESSWDSAHSSADAPSSRPLRHLEALQSVALATATVLDPDEQAKVALDEVIRVMGAERSFLLLIDEGGALRLAAGRDANGADVVELHGYSRTVLERVAADRRPLVLSAGAEGELSVAESIVTHDLRSIVAAPVLVGERLIGVLYLDNRLARGVFGEDDMAVVAAIAAQIAVANETANAFARQAALARENARLLETVREQLAELRLSRGRIAAAEERLRREISELLHSRVQTRLLVAWHRLGMVADLVREQPQEAATAIEQIRDEIDQIREREIRRASHQLHPAVIRVGLVPALRSLAGRFDEQFEVELDVDPTLAALDDPAENRIPEELRLNAYRVVEEALANVARHAGATKVVIGLRVDDGRLELFVRDDGRGFDTSHRSTGLGLTSIAMRVEAIGGLWDVVSAEGAGTTLAVSLPLPGVAAPAGVLA